MKLAISGKGGVGKTTLSSMLAATLGLGGQNVIAIDADPDANLASAMGLTIEQQPTPLAEMGDLIAERTGAADKPGGYFKLNPKVDDIPEEFAVHIGPVSLLALGGVSKGGGGCICPASTLVKALLSHLVLGRDDALIMDMEAGLEHLGRATAGSMDALLVVVNPQAWSIQTAGRVRQLAGDIGLKKIFAVANRVRTPEDIETIKNLLDGLPLIGAIPFDPQLEAGIIKPSTDGQLNPTDAFKNIRKEVEKILANIQASL